METLQWGFFSCYIFFSLLLFHFSIHLSKVDRSTDSFSNYLLSFGSIFLKKGIFCCFSCIKPQQCRSLMTSWLNEMPFSFFLVKSQKKWCLGVCFSHQNTISYKRKKERKKRSGLQCFIVWVTKTQQPTTLWTFLSNQFILLLFLVSECKVLHHCSTLLLCSNNLKREEGYRVWDVLCNF